MHEFVTNYVLKFIISLATQYKFLFICCAHGSFLPQTYTKNLSHQSKTNTFIKSIVVFGNIW